MFVYLGKTRQSLRSALPLTTPPALTRTPTLCLCVFFVLCICAGVGGVG